MARRVSVPGADELFRPTDGAEAPPVEEAAPRPATRPRRRPVQPRSDDRTTSGRVRHDEKMTVYVTAEELLELESARLALRGHGFAVDRGRLVREAIAMALGDLEAEGENSRLVRRLRDA